MLGFYQISSEMVSANPFDLLGDDDNDDPSQLIAKHQEMIAAKKPSVEAAPTSAAKLPTKPLPPAQAGTFFFVKIFLSLLFSSISLFCSA